MATKKKWYGLEDLERQYGPMTVARCIWSWRLCEEMSQAALANKLKISKANLCDIEKGRKLISPARAVKFAKAMGMYELHLVQLAIEDSLRAAHLNYDVELKKKKKKAS